MVISFQLDKQAQRTFADLKKFLGKDTDLDVIRTSLNLLTLAKSAIESGGKIIAKKDSDECELQVKQ